MVRNYEETIFGITQIHDISTVIVRGHVNFEFQEYKQCVVYLNDVYWEFIIYER